MVTVTKATSGANPAKPQEEDLFKTADNVIFQISRLATSLESCGDHLLREDPSIENPVYRTGVAVKLLSEKIFDEIGNMEGVLMKMQDTKVTD